MQDGDVNFENWVRIRGFIVEEKLRPLGQLQTWAAKASLGYLVLIARYYYVVVGLQTAVVSRMSSDPQIPWSGWLVKKHLLSWIQSALFSATNYTRK